MRRIQGHKNFFLWPPRPQLGKNWGPISPVWDTLWITLMAGENLLGGKVDMRKEGRNGPMHVQMGTQGHPHTSFSYTTIIELELFEVGGRYNY
jgi:hypothetical protein